MPSRLVALLKTRGFWILLPLGLHALVFLTSSQVWTEMVTSYSRSGQAMAMSIAQRRLILLAVVYGLYIFSGVFPDVTLPGGRGMRTPTATEVGCALALLRGALLFVVYWSAVDFLRGYLGT